MSAFPESTLLRAVSAFVLSSAMCWSFAARAACPEGFEIRNGGCEARRPCPPGQHLQAGQCVAASICPPGSRSLHGLCVGQPEAGAAASAAKAGQAPASPLTITGGSGMIVTVDPRTGAIVPAARPTLKLSPEEANAASTSSEGLVQTPITHPAGGVKLDHQGRFQSPMTATVGPDGALHVGHPDEAPGDGAHDHP